MFTEHEARITWSVFRFCIVEEYTHDHRFGK